MTRKRPPSTPAPKGSRVPGAFSLGLRRLAFVTVVFSQLFTLGCGGCFTRDADEVKKKLEEEKKKKDPLEVSGLMPMLDPGILTGEDEDDKKPRLLAKPGHWMTTVQLMKANYEDFVGETSLETLDKSGDPMTLRQTNFSLSSQRPVVLSKGRPKRIEGELFIPATADRDSAVVAKLSPRRSGRELATFTVGLQPMMPFQYFILVLADQPDRYAFLKVSDSVRAPYEDEYITSMQHYHVVLPSGTGPPPVPENPLAMTQLAYVFWDGQDPEALTTAQQESLVDWLHWGGRLVVSGPDSLDTLRGSFLAPYLPVEAGSRRPLTAGDLDQLSSYWGNRTGGKRHEPIAAINPWPSIELKRRDGASPVMGTGNLLYEWPVGRGSVVVSSFHIAQRELLTWKGFDGLLNGVLLRRPPREFSKGPYGGLCVNWAGLSQRRLDAHFTTPLRLFARDSGAKANTVYSEQVIEGMYGYQSTETKQEIDRPGGIASWNAFSPVADAARNVLREEAGVTVPGAAFVAFCLTAYLVVLVPLNWAIFHVAGRPEWAWVAAPLIAIAGTVVVVQQAQLDIGFVRSQNEVALLELFGGHDRGHLSRYTALYTSLATTYDLEYDDRRALAEPLPTKALGETASRTFGDRIHEAVSERTVHSTLRGVVVPSAATTMVHAEEVFPLEGPIRLGLSSRQQRQVENQSGLELRDAMVIRRTFTPGGDPVYEGCWLGEVKPRESVLLNFTPIMLTEAALGEGELPFVAERNTAAGLRDEAPFDVGPVLRRALRFAGAEDPAYVARPETRLVAMIDGVLPGAEISPSSSQVRGLTVVVAHLKTDLPPIPDHDLNSRTDIAIKDILDDE